MNLTSNEFEMHVSPDKHLNVVNFEMTNDYTKMPRYNNTFVHGINKNKWKKSISIDNKNLSPKILDRTVVHNFSTIQTKK